MVTNDPNELLTVQYLMDKLKVSDVTIYRLIRIGDLKAVRVGRLHRIRRYVLDAYLGQGAEELHTQSR